MHYRKIWENAYGKIPVDAEGFSYEIHHIDGNHHNNSLDNLQLLSIREHLNIHLEQEDWFAAALIAKRLGLGSSYSSNLQRGKKRPGVGGVPKGSVPWNKGKTYSIETKEKLKKIRKGNRYGPIKISDDECLLIISQYNSNLYFEEVGTICKNGKAMSYEQAFSKRKAIEYGVTHQTIKHIIQGKRRVKIN